jgi:hypothetical protein
LRAHFGYSAMLRRHLFQQLQLMMLMLLLMLVLPLWSAATMTPVAKATLSLMPA